MDIASDPVAATDTPAPAEPPVIRREDYKPFAWIVPQTKLHFDLGVEATTVTATLTVERNSKADAAQVLRLNGDGLTAKSVLVDGEPSEAWTMEGPDLLVTLQAEAHEVTVTTEIAPDRNTALMGLYASNGMLCTQCEAEGFRRITFFPDRPDVLSTYSVRMEGSKTDFPILLCNGNMIASGDMDGGKHFAEWHDPWPKPSYLFALVAGDLVAHSGPFTTRSGREVEYLGPQGGYRTHRPRAAIAPPLDEMGRGDVRA